MAGNKVYITLEVDDKGSAKMKKFGGNADKAFGKIKSNATAGATQAGRMEKAWGSAMTHMKAHSQAYAIAGVAAVTAVAYGIKRFADASIEEYKRYETAVKDMGKITDETAESIKRKIGSIGPEYGDATSLTQAYYNVISAGVTEPVAAMDTLKKSVQTAKAAHIESADVVSGVTALMEAYGDKIQGAGEAADLMFQIEASGKTTVKELIPYIGELAGKSAALGISQDELGASFAQVTLLSGNTSNAATQYKAILTSMMAPSKDMTALLSDYGGAQKAIADMGFEGVLKLISKESGGNAASLQKLMGSAEAVGGMLTLTGNDMKGYTQRLGDMTGKTGLAGKAFDDWSESMEGIDTAYDTSVKKIMVAFGKEIAPMVVRAMKVIIDYAPEIINAIGTFFDYVEVTSISVMDHLMRGWIDLEYAFKTMVAGIKGAWNSGIDLLEEGFADFLESVAAGLDKIPFFSDSATASMRELAGEVRANTDESEGFVASIMKVQAEKEKELAAHDKVIDAMMDEALGYKKTAAAASKTEKQITKSIKKIGKVQATRTKAETKAAKKLAKDKTKAATEFSKKYQKLTLGDYKYAEKQLKEQAKDYKAAGANHLQVEKWLSAEIKNLANKTTDDKTKALDDYARESTKIYERLYDDVQKLDLDDYAYNLQLLSKRYDNKKTHLTALGAQDVKYADGVMLLDKWLAGEQEKLHDDWARKHGTVLDRMAVRWRDYQKEAIDANSIAYDAIAAGAANLEKQLSDNLFNVLTGKMGELGMDWHSLWESMARTVTDAVAKMAVEAAIGTAVNWMTSIFAAKGIWDVDKDEQPVIAHKGEMIVPAKIADKIRENISSSEYNSSFNSLGDMIGGTAKSGSMVGGFLSGTTRTYGQIGAVGALAALNQSISPMDFVSGMLDPTTIATSVMVGGIPGAITGAMGLEGKWSEIGQMVGFVAAMAAGVPGMVAAMFGKPLGAFLGDLAGDALNMRSFESLRDGLEDELGYFSGRQAFSDWGKGMVASGYQKSNIDSWLDDLSIDAGAAGGDPGGGGDIGGDTGGFGSQSSTGMGTGGTSGGFGGSYAREGGVFRGPNSGYPATLHGIEAVVPLSGGRSIPVKVKGGTGGDTYITADSKELLAEIKKLRTDFKAVREDLQAGHYTIASNTGKMAKILDKFDGDGLPAERT